MVEQFQDDALLIEAAMLNAPPPWTAALN